MLASLELAVSDNVAQVVDGGRPLKDPPTSRGDQGVQILGATLKDTGMVGPACHGRVADDLTIVIDAQGRACATLGEWYQRAQRHGADGGPGPL